ncbi:hypothetical protein FSARC_7329 [Fusarium sarcochroum]|uniref:2EXR domain-containing protein n=1 Tax=Fusarium sarcochroum TaxID=1208366 RepID=A0A8H4X831_9HYPO|nr:hypothetical protein FSARC_7329 [Fusarium sarcochroum]
MGQLISKLGRVHNSTYPTFTCFGDLPPELRLLIWKFALPRHRDLRLGRPHTIRPFQPTDGKITTTSMKAPGGLLGACHESRCVALAHGRHCSYTNEILDRRQLKRMAWIDNNIRTLHVNMKNPDLPFTYHVPAKIQAVAELWPSHKSLNRIQKYIIHRLLIQGHPKIETVYVGLSAIPLSYCQSDNVTCSPCVDSDSAVVALDDERLPEYLESAFRVAKSRSSSQLTYHRSAECYLAHLNRWWKTSRRAKALRRTWGSGLAMGVELKPAIMFGETDEMPCSAILKQIMDFIPQQDGLEFELGLAGGKLSRYAVKSSFDCETVCSAAEAPQFVGNSAWDQMHFFSEFY